MNTIEEINNQIVETLQRIQLLNQQLEYLMKMSESTGMPENKKIDDHRHRTF